MLNAPHIHMDKFKQPGLSLYFLLNDTAIGLSSSESNTGFSIIESGKLTEPTEVLIS